MFIGYKIQDWQFFFFECFKDVASLSSHIDSNKKIAAVLICIPLYIMSKFSHTVSDFLLATSLEHLNYDVPWCPIFHVSCAWGSLGLLDLWVYCFCQIWVIISSNIFSVLLSPFHRDSNYLCNRLFSVIPEPTDAVFFFSVFFSLHFILDNFYWCVFNFTNIYRLCSYLICAMSLLAPRPYGSQLWELFNIPVYWFYHLCHFWVDFNWLIFLILN